MNQTSELDQFDLLEEKINSLILMVTELKREKELQLEKIQAQQNDIDALEKQIEESKASMRVAKDRVVSLLEKIEQINV